SFGWYASGDYPYDRLARGDGMQVEVDTRTNDIVYTGSQFGFYSRIERETGRRTTIRPRHELGDPPLRFNWQTPIHLSRHNQDILYYGANLLYRSMKRGEDMVAISPDLTRGSLAGDVPYGTLTTIDESPLQFGLLYTGSDDGYIHVSRDAGHSWTRISDDLPQDRWVSRVEASHHELGRVYVSLNGYRSDDFRAYVYRSDDFGAAWTRIGTNLPAEPVNVITEDPHNGDVIYVGTDHGTYVSLDRGTTFMGMFEDLPAAPVHDIKVQARERDLVIGTHGRSIFVASVSEVEALTPELVAKPVHLFDLEPVTYTPRWGSRRASWAEAFVPEMTIAFYAGSSGEATISVRSEEGDTLKTFTAEVGRGLNYEAYDFSVDEDAVDGFNDGLGEEDVKIEAADDGIYYLVPGAYTLAVSIGADSVEGSLKIAERGSRRE
ncbi:MAG: glycosyl hydrolase, partial [Bacteroidetes bacterium]|nr:glycosyl hydrolase [Bacteroidota bacterium]